MSFWPFRSRTVWIVPIVLLVFVLIQEIITYKVRQHVPEIHVRVAVILALNAFGFAFAAGWLTPKLRELLKSARTRSNRLAGKIGLATFYGLAYGALYFAFLVLEQHGPAGLIPASFR
jgi:phosphoglycerol transferase MdoB-like AlkP superfamily enzyme